MTLHDKYARLGKAITIASCMPCPTGMSQTQHEQFFAALVREAISETLKDHGLDDPLMPDDEFNEARLWGAEVTAKIFNRE